MSPNTEVILVTGASGLLGAHVVHTLLEQGYNVRAVARSAKVDLLKGRYASYGPRVDVFGIDDLMAGDYTAGLSGVSGVIHVASPSIGIYDAQTTVDLAVKGVLNIASQAAKAGIKRFVATSSNVALQPMSEFGGLAPTTLTATNWNTVTEEEVAQNAGNPMFAYASSKALAERALWDFGNITPSWDVTTIVPPMLFGPFAAEFTVAKGDTAAMTSNGWLYQLFTGDRTRAFPPLPAIPCVDIRQAALAHVRALRAPAYAGQKRVLVSAGAFSWRELVEYIAEERPALQDRLIDVGGLPAGDLARSRTTMDTTLARELLGIESFRPWKEFVLEAVDDVLRVEKEWDL